jgi:hypothetical protein
MRQQITLGVAESPGRASRIDAEGRVIFGA